MESHIEQEESDSSRQSADLRIRKTQVENSVTNYYWCLLLLFDIIFFQRKLCFLIEFLALFASFLTFVLISAV